MQENEVARLEEEIQTADSQYRHPKSARFVAKPGSAEEFTEVHWESLCEDHINWIDAERESERLAKLDPLRKALGKSRKPKPQLSFEIKDALETVWPALNRIYMDLPAFGSATIPFATWRPPILRFQVEAQGSEGSPAQFWRIDLKEGSARCDFRYSAGPASASTVRIRAAGGRLAVR